MYYRLFHSDNRGIFQLKYALEDMPYSEIDYLSYLHQHPKCDGYGHNIQIPGCYFFFTEKAIEVGYIRDAIIKILTKDKRIKLLKVESLSVGWEGKSGLQVAGYIERDTQLMLPFI